jgi:hypothetical protein
MLADAECQLSFARYLCEKERFSRFVACTFVQHVGIKLLQCVVYERKPLLSTLDLARVILSPNDLKVPQARHRDSPRRVHRVATKRVHDIAGRPVDAIATRTHQRPLDAAPASGWKLTRHPQQVPAWTRFRLHPLTPAKKGA